MAHQPSYSHDLTFCDLFFFSRYSFWKIRKYSKDCNRSVEGYFSIRGIFFLGKTFLWLISLFNTQTWLFVTFSFSRDIHFGKLENIQKTVTDQLRLFQYPRNVFSSKNIPVARLLIRPTWLFVTFSFCRERKRHSGKLENIQKTVTDQPRATSMSEFHHCYEDWKNRLLRCVVSQGSYFERGNIKLQFHSNKKIEKTSSVT